MLIALRARGLPAAWFAGLALALVVVDLLRAGMGYNPAIPDAHAELPLTGALRYLADRSPQRFAGVGEAGGIPQNVAALNFRIADARGNDPPILKRYNRLWRREVSPEVPSQISTLDFRARSSRCKRIDERRLRTLRLLGVSHLLVAPESAGPPPEGLDNRGLARVYNGRDAQVFRVDGALPRAFVAGAQQTVDGEDAALDAVTEPVAGRPPRGRHREAPRRVCRSPARRRRRDRPDRRLRARPRDHRREPHPARRRGARRQLVPGLESEAGRQAASTSSGSTTSCAGRSRAPAATASNTATSRPAGGSAGS